MRTALISGGTGGLGSAVTATFLERGWRCVVPFVDREQAQALSASLDAERHGRMILVEADMFDQRASAHVVELAKQDGGSLEAALSLVGGFDAPGRVHETPVERFEGQLRLNLRATYLVCEASLPTMTERGGGAIVCVSSRAAVRPFPGAAGYITAKAAVLAFVDALASEYTAAGIRANAVLPSVIDTPANRASQPDADYSRWVPPREIARVIEYLCSAEGAVISGAHIPVYGRA
jgi:NAD(P)-dependent dehydrogenase (short-subunit alcohol dehydrogenase family)